MNEDTYPVSLKKSDDSELAIVWNDGLEQSISFRELRRACQCATCIEKRKAEIKERENAKPGALPILSAADTMTIDIVRMQPAGNYAYNIEFNDGHTTGLFTFEMLRSLESPS